MFCFLFWSWYVYLQHFFGSASQKAVMLLTLTRVTTAQNMTQFRKSISLITS